MNSFAIIGPEGSDSFQAARQYAPDATYRLCNNIPDVLTAFKEGKTDYALIPVYNTREGEVKEYFRLMEKLDNGYWIDNIVLPIHLSLGAISENISLSKVKTVLGRASVLKQCEEYISSHMIQATLVSTNDLEASISELPTEHNDDTVIIETEEFLNRFSLTLIEREIAPYNRTRFAIIGRTKHKRTGYDATSVITRPLPDRVGLLVDTLNEFTRRGINILDLRSENDIKTQKLQIYIEVEGHQTDPQLAEAFTYIENHVIQEENCLKLLGSFPRVDMRVKKIKHIGFIGSGNMSTWFAERLESEGYKTILTGRTSEIRPAEMIEQVDVVVICVPISATVKTIEAYGKYLKEGQALVILAGESETPINSAMQSTKEGVEILFVHNLWGPQAISMKDKNAIVVRTKRSGSLCNEFESFLYKHGADIYLDSADKHDLLMGVSQKLPTTLSVALARTFQEHDISYNDIASHSTLTSLYGILAMTRVHNQNPRTYAEIMATTGEGAKIVESFINNLRSVFDLSEERKIEELASLITNNREYMPESFMKIKMRQAQAVDAVLSDTGFKGE